MIKSQKKVTSIYTMIYFQIHSIIHMVEVARTNQFRIYFDSHQLSSLKFARFESSYRAYISSISSLYENFINGPIKHIYCNDHWPSLSASRSCSLSPSPSPAPALSRNFIFYLRWAPASALAQARSRIYIFYLRWAPASALA